MLDLAKTVKVTENRTELFEPKTEEPETLLVGIGYSVLRFVDTPKCALNHKSLCIRHCLHTSYPIYE